MIIESRQKFSSLQNKEFRLFWFGQIISLSGSWVQIVAQSWLVYLLTKSPIWLGLVASVSALPILLFSLFGGLIADRYPKRNILLITQLLSALLAIALGILVDTKLITPLLVLLIAFFLGVVNSIDLPTRQSFIIELSGKSSITNAIALNSAAFNGARIIGPIIAGFIIHSLGLEMCFYINGFSFIAIIFVLFKIKSNPVLIAIERKNIIKEIRTGWRFIIKTKSIFYIMIMISIFSLFGIPYITLLPLFSAEILRGGAGDFSIMVSSAGLGSFLAVMAIAFKGEIKDKRNFIPLAGLFFSLSILAISFSREFYQTLLFIFFAGAGISGFLAISNSIIQHIVSDSLRGRVMSFYSIVFFGFSPIGNALIGFTTDFYGVNISLKIFATICVLGSIIFGLIFRKQKGFKI